MMDITKMVIRLVGIEMRPGKHGLAFKLDKLTAVIDGLTALSAEAKRQRLIG